MSAESVRGFNPNPILGHSGSGLTRTKPIGLYEPQRSRLAWPHRRRELASDGVRYADARSNLGRRFRRVVKQTLEWHGGVFLLLQQRSKHPLEMVITPKASTSRFETHRCETTVRES